MVATSPSPKNLLSLLCLGDSYTIGESVRVNECWPMQLAAQLESAGRPSSVQIIAKTGWSTDELSEAITAEESAGKLHPPYDFVTLLVGVNDQYRARPASSYTPEFSKLLARAIQFAGAKAQRVLVLSIPDWGRTPFASKDARGSAQISAELDAYNAIAGELSIQAGCHFISITELSRQELAMHPGWLAEDGLHPGPLAYQGWSEKAAVVVLAELAKDSLPRDLTL